MKLNAFSFGSFALMFTLGLGAFGLQGCNPPAGNDDTTDGGVVDNDAGVVENDASVNCIVAEPAQIAGYCGSIKAECGSVPVPSGPDTPSFCDPTGKPVLAFDCPDTCSNGTACVANKCDTGTVVEDAGAPDSGPTCYVPSSAEIASFCGQAGVACGDLPVPAGSPPICDAQGNPLTSLACPNTCADGVACTAQNTCEGATPPPGPAACVLPEGLTFAQICPAFNAQCGSKVVPGPDGVPCTLECGGCANGGTCDNNTNQCSGGACTTVPSEAICQFYQAQCGDVSIPGPEATGGLVICGYPGTVTCANTCQDGQVCTPENTCISL